MMVAPWSAMDKTKWDSGYSNCPCVGSNGQREILTENNTLVIETKQYGLYPADYGEKCEVPMLAKSVHVKSLKG